MIPYSHTNGTLLCRCRKPKFHSSALTELTVPLQSNHYSCAITVHTEKNNAVTYTAYFVNGPLSSGFLGITRGRLLILEIGHQMKLESKCKSLFPLCIEDRNSLRHKQENILEIKSLTD